MLYALVHGELRQPHSPEERAVCGNCKREVFAVLSPEGPAQWQHSGVDCDPWSEPDLAWHAAWKERFPMEFREVLLRDGALPGTHRADLCSTSSAGRPTIVELQHLPVPELEMMQREAFYKQIGRMYWVLHIHDGQSALRTCMQLSLGMARRTALSHGKEFTVLHLPGRSQQFIEQWKQSHAYVVLDVMGQLYHFATVKRSRDLIGTLERGEFAVRPVRAESLVAAVRGAAVKA